MQQIQPSIIQDQYQYHPMANYGQAEFQNPIPNRSLETDDIDGAKSKKLHYFVNRRINNNVQSSDQEVLMQEIFICYFIKTRPQKINTQVEYTNNGKRKYYNSLNNHNQIVPQGQNFFVRGGKRHYEGEEGEIRQFNALTNLHDIPNPLSDEFDRALQTKDIDGAVPGTLISKVVKNKEIAQKLQQKNQQQSKVGYQQLFEQNYQATRYQTRNQATSAPKSNQILQAGQNLIATQNKMANNQMQKSNLDYIKNSLNEGKSQQNQLGNEFENRNIRDQFDQQKYFEKHQFDNVTQQITTHQNNNGQNEIAVQYYQPKNLDVKTLQDKGHDLQNQYFKLQMNGGGSLEQNHQDQQYSNKILELSNSIGQVQVFSNQNNQNLQEFHQKHPYPNNNQFQFMDKNNQLGVDIIGNYLKPKLPEYRIKHQDYQMSKEILGLNFQKVPAAQFRPRPF